jgi:hypothetical protein
LASRDPSFLNERPSWGDDGKPVTRTSKRKPQPRLRALGEEALAVADWASLFGDLARRPSIAPAEDPPVEWRVHDRTHVEFAIDYPLDRAGVEHTWEAYFFVPESFRLHEDTYDKKAIYDDLWSYVRYAVPPVPFFRLASMDDGSYLARAKSALAAAAGQPDGSDASAGAMRKLRLFACMVRASGLTAMREVERRPENGEPFVATCAAIAGALRAVLADARALTLPEEVRIAARWTDEDVSLVLETFCATLGVSLEQRASVAMGPQAAPNPRVLTHAEYLALAEKLAAYAVKEARHRRDAGYDSVGSSASDERGTEHFEFRRHMLKRFTASVLWLSLEVRQAATWIVHALYGVAAATAMAFALAASIGSSPSTSFVRYALPLVVAYAVKDRMKAVLQTAFSGFVSRRFPDRKWSIRDHERRRVVGKVNERAAFLPFRSVPPEVLASRRLTREHALEEQARPERVLWHKKELSIESPVLDGAASGPKPRAAGGAGRDLADGAPCDFTMLTEIFRLNLRRWLAHADDPNRKIVFADPEDAQVYQVTTRRVYNINVVYRLHSGDVESPWHRIRVVVSRKGIERIDAIC